LERKRRENALRRVDSSKVCEFVTRRLWFETFDENLTLVCIDERVFSTGFGRNLVDRYLNGRVFSKEEDEILKRSPMRTFRVYVVLELVLISEIMVVRRERRYVGPKGVNVRRTALAAAVVVFRILRVNRRQKSTRALL